MPRLTKEQMKIQADCSFAHGLTKGRQLALEELSNELKRSKLDQIKAVTELIKVQTENMSKTGYLIAQLNKEKGW